MGKQGQHTEDEPLEGAEKLTFGDQVRANVQPTMLQTDSTTGEVYNPKRRWMKERIQFRKDEETRAAANKK